MFPETLGELGRRAAGIFVFAAVFWASRVVPLFATSMAVVVFSILLLAEEGGFAADGGIESSQFLGEFGSDIIMLFLGGLVISVALSKHQPDSAVAARVLYPFIHRRLRLIYAIMGITAFFSMWMSNTATTAMMLAIVGFGRLCELLRDIELSGGGELFVEPLWSPGSCWEDRRSYQESRADGGVRGS